MSVDEPAPLTADHPAPAVGLAGLGEVGSLFGRALAAQGLPWLGGWDLKLAHADTRDEVLARAQAASIDQVGAAVGQIDQGTQQNAALVEEIAAAASSLRQQANELVAAVSRFRVS